MGFLGLGDLASKDRHKAATPNCIPQGIEKYILSGNFKGELVVFQELYG